MELSSRERFWVSKDEAETWFLDSSSCCKERMGLFEGPRERQRPVIPNPEQNSTNEGENEGKECDTRPKPKQLYKREDGEVNVV